MGEADAQAGFTQWRGKLPTLNMQGRDFLAAVAVAISTFSFGRPKQQNLSHLQSLADPPRQC
jgi:hypothetical protein